MLLKEKHSFTDSSHRYEAVPSKDPCKFNILPVTRTRTTALNFSCSLQNYATKCYRKVSSSNCACFSISSAKLTAFYNLNLSCAYYKLSRISEVHQHIQEYAEVVKVPQFVRLRPCNAKLSYCRRASRP